MSPCPPCPHCQSVNDFHGAFCASCGKALPSATRTPPRIVRETDVAITDLGQEMQIEDLVKVTRNAAIALGIIAAVHFISAFFIYNVATSRGGPADRIGLELVCLGGIGAVFLGLAIWSRFNPLSASIAGLTLYVSEVALETITSPASIASGIILKIIVIVALCKAVQAGLKHRNIRRQAATLA